MWGKMNIAPFFNKICRKKEHIHYGHYEQSYLFLSVHRSLLWSKSGNNNLGQDAFGGLTT